MARLIPTPPTGDIAWAASPMHNKPGRYHFRSRSALTVNNFASLQSRSSVTRSRKKRGDFRNARAEVFDSSRLHLFRRFFGNRKPAMPIVSAINRHQVLAAIGVEEQLRVVCTLGQPYLQRIHGSTNVLDRKASALSDHGVSAISAYDQV